MRVVLAEEGKSSNNQIHLTQDFYLCHRYLPLISINLSTMSSSDVTHFLKKVCFGSALGICVDIYVIIVIAPLDIIL